MLIWVWNSIHTPPTLFTILMRYFRERIIECPPISSICVYLFINTHTIASWWVDWKTTHRLLLRNYLVHILWTLNCILMRLISKYSYPPLNISYFCILYIYYAPYDYIFDEVFPPCNVSTLYIVCEHFVLILRSFAFFGDYIWCYIFQRSIGPSIMFFFACIMILVLHFDVVFTK